MVRINGFGQPIGDDLGDWIAPPAPPRRRLEGRHVAVEPLSLDAHADDLFVAFESADASIWTYLRWGPFPSRGEFASHLESILDAPDWEPHALVVEGVALGYLSYVRISPPIGVIEVGGIALSPPLQRTIASTEAQYLLMRNAFELGYRRYEWKCDALNEPSRVAAERLGFRYEGTFAQALHYKGRNRDTAWFAIIDTEWPAVDAAFRSWLADDNFDADGRQRRSLTGIRQA